MNMDGTQKNMIKPLPGYVLIEPIQEDDRTSGGLYLPDATKDKPSKGKVIVCGSAIEHYLATGTETQYCPVKTGDIVIYKKWTNQEVSYEGKEYLLVNFNELLAIIE